MQRGLGRGVWRGFPPHAGRPRFLGFVGRRCGCRRNRRYRRRGNRRCDRWSVARIPPCRGLRWIAEIIRNTFRLGEHVRETRLRVWRGTSRVVSATRRAGVRDVVRARLAQTRRVRLAVQHELDVGRYVRATRVFRIQQRPPSLDRQVAVTRARPAVAGVRARELVDEFVARVARVTLHPFEFDGTGTPRDLLVDRLDDLLVLDRLLLRVLPAVALPAFDPLRRAVDRVLRIRFDDELLRPWMRAQRLQHGAQFANLIGAVRGAARVVAARIMLVPGFAAVARVLRVIGPRPAHRPVRIAERGPVRRYHNRVSHASTLTAPAGGGARMPLGPLPCTLSDGTVR